MSPESGGEREVLYLPHQVWEVVLDHCRREVPHEACGLLAGRGNRVARAIPLPNVAPDPERAYLAEPESLYRALVEMEERGEEMIGIYHSHPAGPPAPSERDREQAFWPGVAHLVISLAGGRPRACAWRLHGPHPSPAPQRRGPAFSKIRLYTL